MKKGKLIKEIAILCLWIGLGAVLSVLLNNFVLINAQVLTGSMEGTIMAENRVFGLRSGFIFQEHRRGDIVVFESPLPKEFPQPFVKRIIALPGEEIAAKNGIVYIDGVALVETYVTEALRGDFGPKIVPEGHFFVMGDNRNFSRDSREWGAICSDSIIGRIFLGFSPMPAFIGNYVYANQ